MLTLVQKVAVRRHMGVPFAGTAGAGRLYGWRFTWYQEDLEFRMNNMQPPEEQLLTGVSLGSYRIAGAPRVDDVITFTVTDPVAGPQVFTYQVKAADFALPANPVNPADASPLYSIAQNAALAANAALQSLGYAGIGVMPSDNFSPAFLSPYFAQLIIQGPSASLFTLAVSVSGSTNVIVDQPATTSPVTQTFTDPTGTYTKYGWIQICDYLAMGMGLASLSLWLTKADVAEFRHDEVRARRGLYREYCMQLEMALGGAEYVKKFGGGSSAGATA